MIRTRKFLVSITAAALLAIAAAGSALAVAPDNAGCVGQFASTGGSSDGAVFGALISQAALARHPFGATTVSYEAHGDRSTCPFTYPPG